MAKNIAVGIDIGTYQVKVLVAENDETSDSGLPRVIGAGMAESKGLRHGYIINSIDVVKALRSAIAQAERTTGFKIRKACLSIGGIGLSSISGTGAVTISKADSEITKIDLENVIKTAEENLPKNLTQNKKVLHTIPIAYKIDGKIVFGNPLGMHGEKLEVKALFVTCIEHHIHDLIQAVEEVGLDVTNIIASPLAGSLVAATKAQKIAGCVVANIGSETVSVVVFENNIPISLETFPIGGTDITNDIALGLKIPLEEAESIKKKQDGENPYPRKKLEEIIVARLSDIFDLIEAHLKKIGRSGLLPAGIIMTGGGSGIATIEDLARAALRLPSKIAVPNFNEQHFKNGLVKDSSWMVVFGLCVFCLSSAGELGFLGINSNKETSGGIGETLMSLLKKFLP